MKVAHLECALCKARKDSIFHVCHIEDLNLIEKDKTCVIYKTGQPLFYESNHPSALYCVNSGKIKIHKMGTDGKEQIVRLVKPGDFVGYRALIADTPYSASATALEDSTVCIVPKSAFFNLLKGNDAFSEGMMKLLCRNLQDSEKKLTEMAYKPVRERLAEAMLLLKNTYQEPDVKTDFVINLTREDLASLVGTAKETVIRLLSDMKNDKIIKSEGRKITILKPERLLEISNMYD